MLKIKIDEEPDNDDWIRTLRRLKLQREEKEKGRIENKASIDP